MDEEDMDLGADVVEDAESEESGDEGQTIFGYEVNEVEVNTKPTTMTKKDIASGRKDEVDFMKNIQVFDFVDREECWRKTGKAPTTVRWLDNWKMMEDGAWRVRSRLVGRDFKPHGEESTGELFAAMPPLESKKLLFRMAAAGRHERRRRGCVEAKLMFVDVRKANLNAVCDGEAYVELPEEF